MKISIIGAGYVGLCTGAGFASMRHSVVCADIDNEKVNKINNAVPPIFEKDLEKILKHVINKKLLTATTNTEDAVMKTELTFIAVGTPSKKDGSMDMTHIKNSAVSIGKAMKNKDDYHIFVVKSTVLPETTEKIIIPNIEKFSGKKAGVDFGVCVNPEFLREGSALEDFLRPDRIVIGEYDDKSGTILQKLYENFKAPVIRTDIRTAEMIKYASNAFLATKISFINEIGNMCKKLGINTYDVADAMGHDKRIAPFFLEAGIGFGGSCFPKDVLALVSKAREMKQKSSLLQNVIYINEKQPLEIVKLLENKTKIRGRKITLLGLAFKPDTDDVRYSPATIITKALLRKGAMLSAYDPKAMNNMKKIFPKIEYCDSVSDALKDADACLILTGWDEFKKLDDTAFSVMRQKIIIEGRKTLDKKNVKNFEGVCW